MSTPRAVISIEVPPVKSARVETTWDVDNLDGACATLVIRTEGETYFLAFDPTDIQMVQKAIADWAEEKAQ